MALRVKHARTAAEILAVFGSFFLVGSIFYTGLKVRDYKAGNKKAQELFDAINGYLAYSMRYGYPVFIGIWCDVTAVVGIKATSKKRPNNPCMISTFFLLTTILVGALIFYIYDFASLLTQIRGEVGTDSCKTRNQSFWSSCYVRVFLLGILLTVAVVILLLSWWCWLCSFCSLSNQGVTRVHAAKQDIGQQPVPDPADLSLDHFAAMATDQPTQKAPSASTGETILYPSLSTESDVDTDNSSPKNTRQPRRPPAKKKRAPTKKISK